MLEVKVTHSELAHKLENIFLMHLRTGKVRAPTRATVSFH